MGRHLRVRYKLVILVAVPLAMCIFLTSVVAFALWDEKRKYGATIHTDSGKVILTEAEESRLNLLFANVLLAVSINICLSLSLAIFTAKVFERRSEAVRSNLKKLQSGEELNPPMEGLDEFSELDDEVRRTAELLRSKKM